jgi:hypothetical protein
LAWSGLVFNQQNEDTGGNMKPYLIFALSVFATVMVVGPVRAQGVFKVETGKAFDNAVPRDFFLEGNAIPTEKRNAALVITPSGARMVLALIDTSGYSSQVQEKYIGMLITEGSVEVCGNPVAIGSYGFGLAKAAGASKGQESKFILYNQAGHKVTECSTMWDAGIQHPRPLRVVVNDNGSARLYLGRSWVELK